MDKAMRYFIKEARKDREHATKALQSKEWMEKACDMSKEWAKKASTTDVKKLAKESYDYIKMRAHAKTSSGWPMDEADQAKWEAITGKRIRGMAHPKIHGHRPLKYNLKTGRFY